MLRIEDRSRSLARRSSVTRTVKRRRFVACRTCCAAKTVHVPERAVEAGCTFVFLHVSQLAVEVGCARQKQICGFDLAIFVGVLLYC